MRQNSDTPREIALKRDNDDHLADEGDDTLVNGELTKALWTLAAPGKVQMFLDLNEWGQSPYEVELPAEILGAPWFCKNGSELIWVATNFRAVARRVDPDTASGIILGVNVVVVLVAS